MNEPLQPTPAAAPTPTREEFLAWPLTDIRAVAPASLFYAPGGSRRSAVFHGIQPWTSAYFEWGFTETLKCVRTIFEHGVRHIFLPLYMSGHIREYEGSDRHLVQLVLDYIANSDRVAEYRAQGWRVRLLNVGGAPVLAEAAQALAHATGDSGTQTLWLMTSESADVQWEMILALAKDPAIQRRADVVKALYGEEIPPISLYLGFGKPMVNAELFPPLLLDEVQCYWSQQAGYSLSDVQFRKILYDYAYTRQTWRQDKTTRAASAAQDQTLWESEFLLGLGRRVGAFWYPDLQGYPAEHLP